MPALDIPPGRRKKLLSAIYNKLKRDKLQLCYQTAFYAAHNAGFMKVFPEGGSMKSFQWLYGECPPGC